MRFRVNGFFSFWACRFVDDGKPRGVFGNTQKRERRRFSQDWTLRNLRRRVHSKIWNGVCMSKIPQKYQKYLRKFIAWGGAAYIVYFLVNGEPCKALIFGAAFGLFVILYVNYFDDWRRVRANFCSTPSASGCRVRKSRGFTPGYCLCRLQRQEMCGGFVCLRVSASPSRRVSNAAPGAVLIFSKLTS